MRRLTLAMAAAGLVFAGSVHSATYVLNAPQWGMAEDLAVARAGGSVKIKNKGGIAVVESSNPAFLASVGIPGALDETLRVQPAAVKPLAINPNTNPFYNLLQWAPQSIEAPAAWAAGYTGAGVRVAIIDGGIWNVHPDFAGAINTAASRSFVEPSSEPGANNPCRVAYNCDEDPDNFWHGTHVAGIVGARSNNVGVVGIAPQSTLIGVKALHNGSGSFGSVISAILYSAEVADIMNLSLGAVFAKNEAGASELRNALSKAVKIASETTLVIVATGNDGWSFDGNNLVTVPAETGPAMAVSATGPMGWKLGATNFSRLASYSNYGHSLVSVAGPGGDFALPGEAPCPPLGLPCWIYDMVVSTNIGGWAFAAGTSMAAPAVAGVAALVKQKYPGMTPSQLRKHLEKTSTNVGKNNTATHGRGYVNARNAVAN